VGSRIGTLLRFDLLNTGNKTIHSYAWRHASPVREANGGFGCHPDGGLPPGALHHEAAHLGWRGTITIAIDFVQFLDGSVWLSSDPQSSVTPSGLHAGSQRGAEYLLRVCREGGMQSLSAALPCIHRDVQETFAAARDRGERAGAFGFYVGVTRAVVVAGAVSADAVEPALLILKSTEV
jgi:hypothetical protein